MIKRREAPFFHSLSVSFHDFVSALSFIISLSEETMVKWRTYGAECSPFGTTQRPSTDGDQEDLH